MGLKAEDLLESSYLIRSKEFERRRQLRPRDAASLEHFVELYQHPTSGTYTRKGIKW
jgi:hypothetical protein